MTDISGSLKKGFRFAEIPKLKIELLIPICLLILLLTVFGNLINGYLTLGNLITMSFEFAEFNLIAIAMGIVIISGGIDMSIGSIFAVCNFAALGFLYMLEMPFPLIVVTVLLIGACMGAVNGFLVGVLSLRAFLTTLVTMLVYRAVVILLEQAFAVQISMSSYLSEIWDYISFEMFAGLPFNVWLIIIVAVVAHFLLSRSRPGIRLYAIGGERLAARHAGIPIKRTLFFTYVLSGLLAALGGISYAIRVGSSSADTYNGIEIVVISAVILGGVHLGGGRGSVVRMLLGAIIVMVLTNGMVRSGVVGQSNSVILGILLLGVVALDAFISRQIQDSKGGKAEMKTVKIDRKDPGEAPLVSPRPTMGIGEPLLEVIKGSKSFGGVFALEEVDFSLLEGEVHGLVGENGAGKSTLCKALAGAHGLSAGKIQFKNREIEFRQPADALAKGIVMVYQETSLVPLMTVAQNIQLGKESAITNYRRLNEMTSDLMLSLGFNIPVTALVSELSSAQRQMVEIARAIYYNARVIIFDEPTATLTPVEKAHLFRLIKSLKARGIAIVYISHALEESMEIADRITVLRDGKRIITEDAESLDRGKLVMHMVGRDLSKSGYIHKQRPKTTSDQKHEVLEVRHVRKGNMIRDMSFTVYAGEVLGIAGLIGSGRSEIARIIVGAARKDFVNGGEIILHGKSVNYKHPQDAINSGIAYITEDRKQDGFFPTMNILENIYLGKLTTQSGKRFLTSRSERKSIGTFWLEKMNIRSLNSEANINELSGGNQQKVTIAKSLVQNPSIVIFDEPTRGVDVGAIQEIHKTIAALADQGMGVVVISSYLPEILQISDRILIARQGSIVKELDAEGVTEEMIMKDAVH